MNSEAVDAYIDALEENMFLLKQLLKQGYMDILFMPVNRFRNCLKWKNKFDEEVQRLQEEELNKTQQTMK